ncbi:RNA-guided endonuclease InsQ/TnpB family protein [Streptomyces sp. NPDC057686]|uniref:RNA-guided endonuclease InsQ/TnpB family protein n=1 Tax=Streptomyces sp. NPDC057686 TaxID=3346212 RepID=UPI0036758DEA
MSVKRAFKYRFHPTSAQAAELLRTFGCVRKVYDLALAARAEAWTVSRTRVGYGQTSAMLTAWKKTEEFGYLAEVSSVPLQQALRPLDIVWSRPLPHGVEPTTVAVSRDRAGRWHVSILCEDTPAPMPATTTAVGIDAGLTALVTLSTGEKADNPRHERRDRERLARAQRVLARKEKGSNNRAKAGTRVARIHARIADRRRDHVRKLTTRLVRENQTLVIEDLNVRNVVKNHRLARAIHDAAWRELRSMLEYKAAWYQRELITVDRWFPSTRLCSVCGALAAAMPLSVREWTCEGCGAAHDRDGNAAANLLTAGMAVAACGAGARPHRESSSRSGRSVVKQESPPSRVGIPSLQGGRGQENVRTHLSPSRIPCHDPMRPNGCTALALIKWPEPSTRIEESSP